MVYQDTLSSTSSNKSLLDQIKQNSCKCKISNCIIGPNVSIGDEAILNYCILKESILGPFSHIEYAILEKSLIGNDATLCGNKQSLNIGDSTEINFG